MKRSTLKKLAIAALSLSSFAVSAQDQSPIRMLVGFAAGGNVDHVARLLAEELRSQLGRNVLLTASWRTLAANRMRNAGSLRSRCSPHRSVVRADRRSRVPGARRHGHRRRAMRRRCGSSTFGSLLRASITARSIR